MALRSGSKKPRLEVVACSLAAPASAAIISERRDAGERRFHHARDAA
jgi:hypothetical protein